MNLETINSFSVRGLGMRLAALTLWPLLVVALPVAAIGIVWWDNEGKWRMRNSQPLIYWNERHRNALVRSYCTGLHLCGNGLVNILKGVAVLPVTLALPLIWLFTGKRYIRYIRSLYARFGF